MPTTKNRSILCAWLIAGTLDMSTALVVYCVIMKKVSASHLIQGIASGLYGNSAIDGGASMIIAGFILHYMIAFVFTLIYFLIYPRIPGLKKQWYLRGPLYGLIVWMIMNLIVLNIVFPNRAPITFDSFATGASILMVMIGFPVAWFAHRYFDKK